MKKFSGFEAKKQAAREVLPAGGYVVKVLDVAEQHYTWGDVLEISFDVIEGAYTGFLRWITRIIQTRKRSGAVSSV